MMRVLSFLKKKMPRNMSVFIQRIGVESAALEVYRRLAARKIVGENTNSSDPERREVADWIRKNGLKVFPYDFTNKYRKIQVEIHRDDNGYPYVINKGKKLFFKKSMTDEQVNKAYVYLLMEQDKESPHCYVQKAEHNPKEGCVIAELGAAEAMFTLDWIEYCKKAYLFECDAEWIQALRRTFAPYSDKIEIIEKYVGSGGGENTVQLDDYFKDKEVTLIKADIEGAEVDMLKGARDVCTTRIKQAYICTYHRWNHPDIIRKLLEQYGFQTEFNKRYMFMWKSPSEFQKCSFRRGIIYGWREE